VSNKPNVDFLVIGAQKCATSWIYYCLRDHPEIHVPSAKREDVYLGGELHRERGTDWYFDHIGDSNAGDVVGDVSVDYLFDRRSPAAVREHIPDVKLIVSLREPVARAISAYYWNLRRGNIHEMDLGKGMQRSLESAKAVKSPGFSYDPENYHANVLARGVYDVQVKRYLDAFGADQVLILPFDRIKTEGDEMIKYIYRYLEVDSSFRPGRLSRNRRPKQNSYRPSLLRFERDTPNTAFYGRIANLAHQFVCRLGLNRSRPRLPEEVEDKLRRFYRPHVQNLFSLVQDLPRSQDLWREVSWERSGVTGEEDDDNTSVSGVGPTDSEVSK
jgi:hypothetical protein